jgi:hypothetical protein
VAKRFLSAVPQPPVPQPPVALAAVAVALAVAEEEEEDVMMKAVVVAVQSLSEVLHLLASRERRGWCALREAGSLAVVSLCDPMHLAPTTTAPPPPPRVAMHRL